MADLKRLGRLIGQPLAPDLSGAAKVHASLGNAVQGLTKLGGEYVEGNRIIAEKSVLAAATSKFEMDYITFKNDPNITQESFAAFQQNMDSQAEGFFSQGPRGRETELSSGLKSLKQNYTAKAYDDLLQQSVKNEKRDISLALNEYQTLYGTQISQGDYGAALETKSNLAELLKAFAERGASASDIIKISEDTDTLGIASEAITRLKNAQSEDERIEIMRHLSSLPSSKVNDNALNIVWKQFTKLNQLYKDADDQSEAWGNIASGNQWLNRKLPQKEADKIYDSVNKNLQSRNGQTTTQPGKPSTYQAFPAYKDQPKTYDYEEDIAAEQEGRSPRRYLVDSAAVSMQQPEPAQTNVFQSAEAHLIVGSKNATKFPRLVENSLYGGNGEQANAAVIALTHVYDTNPACIELDAETEMLYTEFKIAADNGRTDYDKIIDEARNSILGKARTNAEINTNIYNNKYGVAGKGLTNLNKSFKDATGVDALDTGSTAALRDYNSILRNKFILSDGRPDTAQEAARRDIGRSHGVDKFTNGRYISYPPSLLLQGQSEGQISNQFLTQLIAHSEKNDSLIIPEAYQAIKKSTDTDRALVDYSQHYTLPFIKSPFESQIKVHLKIEGRGDVEGTFFVKPNVLTTQNNSGMPVWEAWIADSDGNEYPIPDETSPYKNTLLIFGKPLSDFAPEYVKDQDY